MYGVGFSSVEKKDAQIEITFIACLRGVRTLKSPVSIPRSFSSLCFGILLATDRPHWFKLICAGDVYGWTAFNIRVCSDH